MGECRNTVDFCKNKTKADREICIYLFENENKKKFIRREHTKMITNCMPGMRKIAYTLTALSDKNKRL